MNRPTDTVIIFVTLWLLAAMVIDALTPRELSVYMIGAALAPAAIIGALFHYLRLPRVDLAITLAVLWLIAVMILEWITPKPLAWYMIAAAVVPSIVVGGWLRGSRAWHRRTNASGLPPALRLE